MQSKYEQISQPTPMELSSTFELKSHPHNLNETYSGQEQQEPSKIKYRTQYNLTPCLNGSNLFPEISWKIIIFFMENLDDSDKLFNYMKHQSIFAKDRFYGATDFMRRFKEDSNKDIFKYYIAYNEGCIDIPDGKYSFLSNSVNPEEFDEINRITVTNKIIASHTDSEKKGSKKLTLYPILKKITDNFRKFKYPDPTLAIQGPTPPKKLETKEEQVNQTEESTPIQKRKIEQLEDTNTKLSTSLKKQNLTSSKITATKRLVDQAHEVSKPDAKIHRNAKKTETVSPVRKASSGISQSESQKFRFKLTDKENLPIRYQLNRADISNVHKSNRTIEEPDLIKDAYIAEIESQTSQLLNITSIDTLNKSILAQSPVKRLLKLSRCDVDETSEGKIRNIQNEEMQNFRNGWESSFIFADGDIAIIENQLATIKTELNNASKKLKLLQKKETTTSNMESIKVQEERLKKLGAKQQVIDNLLKNNISQVIDYYKQKQYPEALELLITLYKQFDNDKATQFEVAKYIDYVIHLGFKEKRSKIIEGFNTKRKKSEDSISKSLKEITEKFVQEETETKGAESVKTNKDMQEFVKTSIESQALQSDPVQTQLIEDFDTNGVRLKRHKDYATNMFPEHASLFGNNRYVRWKKLTREVIDSPDGKKVITVTEDPNKWESYKNNPFELHLNVNAKIMSDILTTDQVALYVQTSISILQNDTLENQEGISISTFEDMSIQNVDEQQLMDQFTISQTEDPVQEALQKTQNDSEEVDSINFLANPFITIA